MQCFAPVNPKFPQFRGWSDPPVQGIESPARPQLVPVSRLAPLYPIRPQHATLGSGAARTGRSPVNSPRIEPRTADLADAVSSQHLHGEWWEHWDGTRGQDSARKGLVLAVGTSWTTAFGSSPRGLSAYIYRACRGLPDAACMRPACCFSACWCLLCRKEFCRRQTTRIPSTCGRRHGLRPSLAVTLPADVWFNILQNGTIYRRRADRPRQLSRRTGRAQVDAQLARCEIEPNGTAAVCDSPRTPLQIKFRQQFPTGQGVRAAR